MVPGDFADPLARRMAPGLGQAPTGWHHPIGGIRSIEQRLGAGSLSRCGRKPL